MQEPEMQVRSLGREDSPGRGHGNPLQYSCLENLMDRGAWRVIVHGVAMSVLRENAHDYEGRDQGEASASQGEPKIASKALEARAEGHGLASLTGPLKEPTLPTPSSRTHSPQDCETNCCC